MVLRRPNACAEDYQNHMRWKIPDWNPSKIAVGLALQEGNAALTVLEASLRAKTIQTAKPKRRLGDSCHKNRKSAIELGAVEPFP